MSCTRYLLRERSSHRVRAGRMATGSKSPRSRATRAAWDRHSHRYRCVLSLYDLSRKDETPMPGPANPDISVYCCLLQSNCQERNSKYAGIQLSGGLRGPLVSILRLSRKEIRDLKEIRAAKGGGLYSSTSTTDW